MLFQSLQSNWIKNLKRNKNWHEIEKIKQKKKEAFNRKCSNNISWRSERWGKD